MKPIRQQSSSSEKVERFPKNHPLFDFQKETILIKKPED